MTEEGRYNNGFSHGLFDLVDLYQEDLCYMRYPLNKMIRNSSEQLTLTAVVLAQPQDENNEETDMLVPDVCLVGLVKGEEQLEHMNAEQLRRRMNYGVVWNSELENGQHELRMVPGDAKSDHLTIRLRRSDNAFYILISFCGNEFVEEMSFEAANNVYYHLGFTCNKARWMVLSERDYAIFAWFRAKQAKQSKGFEADSKNPEARVKPEDFIPARPCCVVCYQQNCELISYECGQLNCEQCAERTERAGFRCACGKVHTEDERRRCYVYDSFCTLDNCMRREYLMRPKRENRCGCLTCGGTSGGRCALCGSSLDENQPPIKVYCKE